LASLQNDNSGNQLIMSRKPYVNSLNIVKTIFFYYYFRRKYHAGVMLGGTGSIYIQPKAHSKWKEENLSI